MTLLQHELTDFTVQAFQNNEFHEVTKADVLGHWSVFFFYPADFTFVCPTELEDLAAKYEDFKKIGCEIYSVSCDTHFVHKAWHDANEKIAKIQYPMLADPTALLAKDLDTYNEADGVAERGDFIVNPEARSWPTRSSPPTSAVMPTSCCAACRPRSSSTSTATRCARPSGPPARRPSSRASTSSVSSDFPPH
ncbi:peroxiredoxin [Bifidobacterium bifidum]|nr:peroxiredoxin [Bifidobacterium bifidum]